MGSQRACLPEATKVVEEMTELTQAEQAEAKQIMMHLPGMTFEVQPSLHSRDVGGLLFALRMASQKMTALHRQVDAQEQAIRDHTRDVEGLRRILGVAK